MISRKKILAAVLSGVFVLGTVSTAFASTPPGQRGYEGQPGNQGGGGAKGLRGYEGQPGNQGGH